MDNLHILFVMPNAKVKTTQNKLNSFLKLIEERYGSLIVLCCGKFRSVTWKHENGVVVVSTIEIE